MLIFHTLIGPKLSPIKGLLITFHVITKPNITAITDEGFAIASETKCWLKPGKGSSGVIAAINEIIKPKVDRIGLKKFSSLSTAMRTLYYIKVSEIANQSPLY